jgi:ABC-type Fe3+ transport system permease subunit
LQRAYLIILIPAVLVGISYVAIFRWLGFDIPLGPLLGTAAAFLAALFGVWRYQRRKQGGRRG